MADEEPGVLAGALNKVGEETRKFGQYITNSVAGRPESWMTEQERLQKNYKYNILQYPLKDLGPGSRNPYYMTFYILEQDLSENKKKASGGPVPQSTAAIQAQTTNTLQKNFSDTGIGFGRKTHRSSTCIRLFMPDTLSWNYANAWRDVDLSGQPFADIAQALTALPKMGESMTSGYQSGGITGLLASLKSKESIGALGPAVERGADLLGIDKGLALSAAGVAVNPQVDVIYQSPELRTFTFDFLLAPRSSAEAAAVAAIVHEFKLAASPEMLGQGIGVGRYFVPPSEFDIEFSVKTMGRISSCVLQTINVDYAPSGAAFYKDDYPVYTRLTLIFKELEFMTKLHINRGF